MRVSETYEVIDTHTEGEPTRILLWTLPIENAEDPLKAREYFQARYDYLRTAILHEPRGHSDQFGAVVIPSPEKDVDYTLFFTTASGYLDMCGHATIGVSTALVTLGRIIPSEPVTEIRYRTPAGYVTAKVNVEDGEVRSVTVVDVTSLFIGGSEVYVDEPINRKIHVNVSYGGNFYAIVDAEEIGLEVVPADISHLREAGKAISKAVYEQARPRHPTNHNLRQYPLTMITGKPVLKPENYRNVVIFGDGSFDRSPCGTGTASRAAFLHSMGKLGEGESFVHESINNTSFRCKIVATEEIGGEKAIVPEITGSAWITQISHVIIDPDDPLRNGFLVK